MCKWYFSLALIFCFPAFAADPTFSVTAPEGKLTLTSAPCKAHEWLKGWQVAKWSWKGKNYEACWRMQVVGPQEKLVVVLDAGGDVSTFIPTQFVKDEAI